MIVSMNLTACSDDDEILFTVQASMPYFHENLYVPNENGNKAISNTKKSTTTIVKTTSEMVIPQTFK